MVMYIGGQKISPIIKIGEINNQDKTITENGTYTADTGYTGLGEVTVNVPSEQPVITELNVTPTTSAQTITPPSGTDGYAPVNVAAVTSSIDSNIVAGNIKSGVQILGVTGNVVELNGETKVITPTTSVQTINPSSGKNAITQATVAAVTSSIDSNIVAGNIKSGVQILGVTGNYSGTTPTGTLSITANGVYDVTNYASANVNVSGGSSFIGFQREVSAGGVYQMPTTSFAFSLPSNATNVGINAMSYAFRNCLGLTSADLSSLTTVSESNAMSYAFSSCPNLTSVDLSSLTTVSGSSAMGYAFYNCASLTSVDLSSLTTVSGSNAMSYAFQGCTRLTSVDLSSLTTVSDSNAMFHAFQGCTSLTSVDLSSLTTVSGSSAMSSAFYGCTRLTALSFPALTSTSFGSYTNQFNNMLQGVTGCTVHFPSSLQSVIGSWSDVTAGFGGTNTTVLFDLPATDGPLVH